MEKAIIKFFDQDSQKTITENVWVEFQNDVYILENIPCYAYFYSYKDTVSIDISSGKKIITGIVKSSGNSTIRILFFDMSYISIVRQKLDNSDYISETSLIDCMLAVNIPKQSSYSSFLNIIKKYCDDGIIDYEEGALTEEHKAEII